MLVQCYMYLWVLSVSWFAGGAEKRWGSMSKRGKQEEDRATLIALETKPENDYGSIAMVTAVSISNLINNTSPAIGEFKKVLERNFGRRFGSEKRGVPQRNVLESLFFILNLPQNLFYESVSTFRQYSRSLWASKETWNFSMKTSRKVFIHSNTNRD